MRALILACLFISHGGATHAKEPQAFREPSGVTVLKQSWSKEWIYWEKDPLGTTVTVKLCEVCTVEGFDELRRRVGGERPMNTGQSGEANKIEQAARTQRAIKSRSSPPPRYAFLYKATFRNDGAKAIKAVDWDYVFFDAATGEELGRRRFANAEVVAPGETRELSQLIGSPPTHRISAYALGKRERDGLREQAVIMRVSYTDGTEWRGGAPIDVSR